MEAWNRLEDIFQDKQNARVVTLEREFSNTRMEDFPNVSTYCQHLKMLSDQLRNVGSPVNNHRLARSILTLEEVGMTKMANTDSHVVVHTTQLKPTKDTSQRGNRRPRNRSRSRGNQGRGRGGGRGNRSAPQSGAPSAPSPWSTPPWQQQQQYPTWKPWGWTPPPWTMPPCPCPTSQWRRPVGPPKQPDILGQCSQVYATSTSSQILTDIETAMHTMSLHTLDNQWYMDTGTTSHTAASQGNLSSYFLVSNSSQKVIVGSGHGIPIHGTRHA
ncbi:uncharacterized protein LOC127104492 [Lathyrus oleraceus]|uniref:uncharacterized protein LOC127104492 n=1 Tax=Pisum sativum TaxID=3888 RepID=UPI0021D09D62|nr:uncharacterized protein LOC127104492 [Pisum sativum]